MATLLYYDTETTGTNYKVHSIHQISCILEIDNVIVDKWQQNVRPHPKARIESQALKICFPNMEFEAAKSLIESYEPQDQAFKRFINWLNKYIDPRDINTRAYLVGFNNIRFDDNMLNMWFTLNDNDFMYAYFYSHSFDTITLAGHYLKHRRARMPSFKLVRVAKELGIPVDDDRLHDSTYDTELTRLIFRIVTGIDPEPAQDVDPLLM